MKQRYNWRCITYLAVKCAKLLSFGQAYQNIWNWHLVFDHDLTGSFPWNIRSKGPANIGVVQKEKLDWIKYLAVIKSSCHNNNIFRLTSWRILPCNSFTGVTGASCSQLYQHFMSSFCQFFLSPKNTKPKWTREKLLEALSYEKSAHKMLMKLTPLVNFTNILQAAFFANFPFYKKLQTQTASVEKLRKTLFCKKMPCKCWWNLHLYSTLDRRTTHFCLCCKTMPNLWILHWKLLRSKAV